MRFKVISRSSWPSNAEDTIYLKKDNWDDYCYQTTFAGYYKGNSLGLVKIAYKGMEKGDATYDHIPKEFSSLDESYISLWQSEDSYVKIRKISQQKNINLFEALNDIAYNTEKVFEFRQEGMLRESLMRAVSDFQCREQFHRIANGGVKVTAYHFNVSISSMENEPLNMIFDVDPHGKPSSNIHILIGRNGIGKTNLLRSIVCSICGAYEENVSLWYDEETKAKFANVLCVSFSPFDDYSKVINLSENPVEDFPGCSYIGLDRNNMDLVGNITKNFIEDLKDCFASHEKTARWKNVIDILSCDPMFAAIDIGALTDKDHLLKDGKGEKKAIEIAEEKFALLSSGHKCVLSILTSCVSKLEEKSIVLLDEPENHLHPPLLAALIQALEYLLENRNGVAIISTHSPVVLQEVPKECVWILDRSGDVWSANRPNFETYGADIGSLTREVFGLEVLMSGYHKKIKDAIDGATDIEDVFEEFNYHLGNEASGLIHVLWATKARNEETNE